MRKSPLIIALIAVALFVGGCAEQSENQNTETETTSEAPAASQQSVAKSQQYNVDVEKSVVKWKGTMLGVKEHTGILKFAKGAINVSGDKVLSGELVVEMNSIQATDENYNPEEGYSKEKLIGHLKSPDFFSVEAFPHARFKFGSVEDNSVSGEMTIRGNTNKITAEVTDMHMHDGELHIVATAVLDRQKYEVAWEAVGDVVLSDEIEIEVDISAKRQ